MFKLKNCADQKIAVLGLGSENEALLEWLASRDILVDVTIYDRRTEDHLQVKREKIIHLPGRLVISWRLGEQSQDTMKGYDELWRSPGWPIFCPQIQEAIKSGSRLTSPMNLFFAACLSNKIIGVTGSKGKGTTSSLIDCILRQAGYQTFLGGNIGVAPFSFIEEIKQDSWVILELSSFQLEDLHYSPHIAVLTNIYEEHLAPADPANPNYHKNLNDYQTAKQQIFLQQKKGDWLVINKKLNNQFDINLNHGRIKWFGKSLWPSRLVGEHNQENVAAAQAVAGIVGVPEEKIKQAVAEFQGLEHRLEFVATKAGISYYDDSFATNPIATEIALRSFNQPIILLAGGADKGNDFTDLAATIVRLQVKMIILFEGQASPRLQNNLLAAGYQKDKIISVDSMSKAMTLAQQKAVDGDVVLLSTACASFGLFNNYKERGNLFKQAV
jgi:UDP-N-acetylmuramoylalanine--D-glutamate ligase